MFIRRPTGRSCSPWATTGSSAGLCDVIGRPTLATDVRFATNPQRVANRDALNRELSGALAAATADQWWERLTPAGVPCGPINDIAAAVALAERLGLDPVVEVPDAGRTRPSRQVAHPVRFSATPARYELAPPLLGDGAHPGPA